MTLGCAVCSWRVDGFWGRVKSWIWSGWLRWSFILWICPLAWAGADTCSLCLDSSTQKVKKNIWCMKQAGEANLVCCLHIIISVRQLAPTHQEKKKKIASRLDSFLCLCDFNMLTCIRDCAVSKELKTHLHVVWEEIWHIIVRLCIILATQKCTRINILFMF